MGPDLPHAHAHLVRVRDMRLLELDALTLSGHARAPSGRKTGDIKRTIMNTHKFTAGSGSVQLFAKWR
jgi:hypothetical protein